MAKGETYEEFVEKFKPKLTTDDCMTPEPVYKVVKDWVMQRYNINPETRIVRPFWPGADYKTADYSGDCVVIDNPPFSILASIKDWYIERGINFFLFAPDFTLFSSQNEKTNYIIAAAPIIYENGAAVRTNFVTNLGDVFIEVAPDLHTLVKDACKAMRAEQVTHTPKYCYPDEVCHAARLDYLAVHGKALQIAREDTYFIRALDAQREKGKTIFGSGFLLSEKAAAEKAAAEKAAAEKAAAEKAAAEKAAAEKAAAEKAAAEKAAAVVWELSARELKIVQGLGKKLKGGG